MIYIRPEGGKIRNGLNFYPWSDKQSFGFILRIGNWGFRVRRSTPQKRWLVGTL